MFHRLLEIVENSNRTFWSNEGRPTETQAIRATLKIRRRQRRPAEVENIFLHISGSRRARFPAVAVLSATSKQSVCRFV